MRILRLLYLAVAGAFLAVGIASPAAAQRSSDIATARQAGVVGERYDGYLGFAEPAGGELRRQVNAINIRRRSIYTSLAARRRLTPQVIGIAAGCVLLARTAPGQAYLLSDGAWRRRGPGDPPPVPPHCARN